MSLDEFSHCRPTSCSAASDPGSVFDQACLFQYLCSNSVLKVALDLAVNCCRTNVRMRK